MNTPPSDAPAGASEWGRPDGCPHCGDSTRLMLTCVVDHRIIMCPCMFTDKVDTAEPFSAANFAMPAYWSVRHAGRAAELEVIVVDLSMIVKQCLRSVRKTNPKRADAFWDYLVRKGIQGSPLRATPAQPPEEGKS